MHLLGYPEDSLKILQEGEEQAREIDDEENLSILSGKLGSYYAIRGESFLALKHTEAPFRDAQEAQDIDRMAPIAGDLFSIYHVTGNHAGIADTAPKVLAALEKTHREKDFFGTRYNVYSGVCAHCVYSYGMLGRFKEGGYVYEKGLHFALDLDQPYGLAFLELAYGALMNNMGNGEKAIEHLRKSIRYSEEAQAVYMLGPSWGWLGQGYYLTGDLKNAKSSIVKGIEIHMDTKLARWLPTLFSQLGMVYLESDDLSNAEECFQKALRLSQENHERHWEGFSRIWLGRLSQRLARANAISAEDNVIQGIDICNELKLKPYSALGYLFLGELHSNRDQPDRALEDLKKAEVMFREMEMDYWLGKTQEVLEGL
jgi:tetratricopeptide (TPR) repeat protein